MRGGRWRALGGAAATVLVYKWQMPLNKGVVHGDRAGQNTGVRNKAVEVLKKTPSASLKKCNEFILVDSSTQGSKLNIELSSNINDPNGKCSV